MVRESKTKPKVHSKKLKARVSKVKRKARIKPVRRRKMIILEPGIRVSEDAARAAGKLAKNFDNGKVTWR